MSLGLGSGKNESSQMQVSTRVVCTFDRLIIFRCSRAFFSGHFILSLSSSLLSSSNHNCVLLLRACFARLSVYTHRLLSRSFTLSLCVFFITIVAQLLARLLLNIFANTVPVCDFSALAPKANTISYFPFSLRIVFHGICSFIYIL